MRPIFLAFIVTLIIAGLSPVHADMVFDWNNYALEAIKTDKTPPPKASRALAISQAAIYDAVNSISPTYTPYRYQLPGYTGASANAAVAAAGYTALYKIYNTTDYGQTPSAKNKILNDLTTHYNASMVAIPDSLPKTLGIQLGKEVASKLVRARNDDGWNVQYDYTPKAIPGRWQPTPPSCAPFLLPQWADVTPFTMTSGDQFRSHNPPALTSCAYAKSLNEVKSLGALNSNTRTPDQTEIAKFWSDGAGTVTPPGHWNTIAQTVAKSQHNDLTKNARLFALLDLSLADAGIAAWDMKRYFDYWRPITAIRNADKDGNATTAADSTWEPLLTTPSFPSCVSGHSTFSGAAATILAKYFGTDDIAFSSKSDGLPGVKRNFDSFSEAALEASHSRIYGGIHFNFDSEYGLKAGEDLGEYAFKNLLSPLKSSTVPLPGALSLGLTGLVRLLLMGWRRIN